jgi:type IV secretion system protein VirD4
MLPQEVRSLGNTREIVFTEDTPPILCRKIRYYRVPALRNRIRKPPAVPMIELRQAGSHARGAAEPLEPGASSDGDRVDSEAGPPQEAPRADVADAAPGIHEAGVEDIDRVDSLTLEDFETDFSRVDIPEHDGPLTGEEMQTAVTSFLDTLKIEAPHGR